MDDADHEPVFIKSRWGTNRYVYNHRNPVGFALILISPVIAIIAFLLLRDASSWSGDELDEAVHQAAGRLQEEPQIHDSYRDRPWEISEVIEDTGAGPRFGRLHVDATDDGNGYEITADGTDAGLLPARHRNPDRLRQRGRQLLRRDIRDLDGLSHPDHLLTPVEVPMRTISRGRR